MRNSKVHVTIGDARELLLTTTEQDHVIASEPSNPYRAGVASLFTREYDEGARNRLGPDGIFVQWVQAYEIDAPSLKTVYATMSAAFPHVETWQLSSADLALVGSIRAPEYREDVLDRRIREEPFRSALRVAWRSIDLNGFFAHYIARDTLARAMAALEGVEVSTDDRNLVEFGFARSVGRGEANVIAELRHLAQSLGVSQPPLRDHSIVDWPTVQTAWVTFQASAGFAVSASADVSEAERERQNTIIRDYTTGVALAEALDAWDRQARPPADPGELAMVADLHAQTGSELAVGYLTALRAHQPGEADTFLAQLRAQQGRYEEASLALESAFRQFRIDPWALTRFKLRALDLAGVVATRHPAGAGRLFEAVRQPFAIKAVETDRRATATNLAQIVDFARLCSHQVAASEPHVPWTRTFLVLRRDCYRAAGDPRLDVATRDLQDFLSQEAPPLADGFDAVPQ